MQWWTLCQNWGASYCMFQSKSIVHQNCFQTKDPFSSQTPVFGTVFHVTTLFDADTKNFHLIGDKIRKMVQESPTVHIWQLCNELF